MYGYQQDVKIHLVTLKKESIFIAFHRDMTFVVDRVPKSQGSTSGR